MKASVIGIDVGKYELVIYWNGKFTTLKNDEKELTKWVKNNCERGARGNLLWKLIFLWIATA